MDERAMMIGEWLRGESTVSALAVKYGVSRKVVYKWIARHEEGGWEAFTHSYEREVEATIADVLNRCGVPHDPR